MVAAAGRESGRGVEVGASAVGERLLQGGRLGERTTRSESGPLAWMSPRLWSCSLEVGVLATGAAGAAAAGQGAAVGEARGALGCEGGAREGGSAAVMEAGVLA